MPPNDHPQWAFGAHPAVGDHVRVQRMHFNLTHAKLAKLAGAERGAAQRIECGGEAKISCLLLIARGPWVHVRDLLG